MQAFQTALRPSRTARMLTICLHVGVALACLAAFHGTQLIAGLILLAAGLMWAWRTHRAERPDAVSRIAVNRHGHASVFIGSGTDARPAGLCAGSLACRYALFLKWHIDGKPLWHLVLPDMTDRESYRRLLVWARWGQPKTD